jgi:UDPglucose 6-dehydrogenase
MLNNLRNSNSIDMLINSVNTTNQNIQEFAYNICCIGAGYVGGPMCAVMAKYNKDTKINVVDYNFSRIHEWNSSKLPIYEPGLDKLVLEYRNKNLFFSNKIGEAIEQADMIFIAVNTPTKESGVGAGYTTDLSYVENAAREILKYSKSSKIIVEKSTVPCRTAEFLRTFLNENSAPEIRFEVLSNPEFLSEGNAIANLLEPDRVLIGFENTDMAFSAAIILEDVYLQWVPDDKIILMSDWSAELTKLAANAMLAQRISSINALSAMCDAIGADIIQVSKAIGADHRIGPAFLNPSPGFGGSCFKKDILNLSYIAYSLGLNEVADYWHQIHLFNEYQKIRFSTTILRSMFNSLRNKTICIFGFAYKANTNDTRESPAIDIVKNLLKEGAKINIYDPKVSNEQIKQSLITKNNLKSQIQIERDVKTFGNTSPGKYEDSIGEFFINSYKAAHEADAIVLLTEWHTFTQLDYKKIYNNMNKPAYIFDGRFILNHAELKKIGFKSHNY